MTLPTDLYPQYLREKAVSWMIIISVGFHLAVIGGAIIVPWLSNGSHSMEPVYTVELVDMPSRTPAPAVQGPPQKEVKESAPKTPAQSKPVELPETATRIPTPNVKPEVAEPIPIVKSPQNIKVKVNEAKTEERITSQLEKLKKEVDKQKKQDKDKDEAQRLSKALENLKTQETQEEARRASAPTASATQGAEGTGAGGGQLGLKLEIYKTRVWNKVRSNWSYPDILAAKQSLEAVVLVTVTSEGQIRDSRLLKRSGNSLFDQSVLRAVKLSEPLPPFPEGYVKRMEELELRFSLAELAGNS